MVRVAISGDVLRWAMDRAGLTPDELRPHFPRIQDWLSGVSQPTLPQLQDLARRTLTPLGFLFLDTPPRETLPIKHFRTVAAAAPTRPSAELLSTVWAMQRRQAWMREYLIEKGAAPLPFVGSAQASDPPASVGQQMRDALGLRDDWAAQEKNWEYALRVLREAMDAAGILVVVNGVVGNNTHQKLSVDEFRGFVLVDEYAPLAFVNGADGKAAQMFTLGHELAHVFFGSSAAFDLREMQPADDDTELACNRAAAEFLIPAEQLRGCWNQAQRDPRPLQWIARQFKISELVAARRALDLSLMDRSEFFRFYQEYLAQEHRSRASADQGGNYYKTQPLRVGRRFAAAIIEAVQNDDLLYSEAYELTGLNGKTFDKFALMVDAGEAL